MGLFDDVLDGRAQSAPRAPAAPKGIFDDVLDKAAPEPQQPGPSTVDTHGAAPAGYRFRVPPGIPQLPAANVNYNALSAPSGKPEGPAVQQLLGQLQRPVPAAAPSPRPTPTPPPAAAAAPVLRPRAAAPILNPLFQPHPAPNFAQQAFDQAAQPGPAPVVTPQQAQKAAVAALPARVADLAEQRRSGAQAFDPFRFDTHRPRSQGELGGDYLAGMLAPLGHGAQEKVPAAYLDLVRAGKLTPPAQIQTPEERQRVQAIRGPLQDYIQEQVTAYNRTLMESSEAAGYGRINPLENENRVAAADRDVAGALKPDHALAELKRRGVTFDGLQGQAARNALEAALFTVQTRAEVNRGYLFDAAITLAAGKVAGMVGHAVAPALEGAGLFAQRVGTGAAEGAAFGAAQQPAVRKIQDPNASPQDLLQEALTGAGIGALGGAALGGVGHVFLDPHAPPAAYPEIQRQALARELAKQLHPGEVPAGALAPHVPPKGTVTPPLRPADAFPAPAVVPPGDVAVRIPPEHAPGDLVTITSNRQLGPVEVLEVRGAKAFVRKPGTVARIQVPADSLEAIRLPDGTRPTAPALSRADQLRQRAAAVPGVPDVPDSAPVHSEPVTPAPAVPPEAAPSAAPPPHPDLDRLEQEALARLQARKAPAPTPEPAPAPTPAAPPEPGLPRPETLTPEQTDAWDTALAKYRAKVQALDQQLAAGGTKADHAAGLDSAEFLLKQRQKMAAGDAGPTGFRGSRVEPPPDREPAPYGKTTAEAPGNVDTTQAHPSTPERGVLPHEERPARPAEPVGAAGRGDAGGSGEPAAVHPAAGDQYAFTPDERIRLADGRELTRQETDDLLHLVTLTEDHADQHGFDSTAAFYHELGHERLARVAENYDHPDLHDAAHELLRRHEDAQRDLYRQEHAQTQKETLEDGPGLLKRAHGNGRDSHGNTTIPDEWGPQQIETAYQHLNTPGRSEKLYQTANGRMSLRDLMHDARLIPGDAYNDALGERNRARAAAKRAGGVTLPEGTPEEQRAAILQTHREEVEAARNAGNAQDQARAKKNAGIRKTEALKKLDAIEAAAAERIKGRGGRLQSGLNPEDLADYAVIGAVKIARGAVKFADWSTEMLRQFGDEIRPHLKRIWAAAREHEILAQPEGAPAAEAAPRKGAEKLTAPEPQARETANHEPIANREKVAKPEPKPEPATGLANQVQEREAHVLAEPEKGTTRTAAEAQIEGKKLVDAAADPIAHVEQLARKIADEGRPASHLEAGQFLEGKRRLLNAANDAGDSLDKAVRSGAGDVAERQAQYFAAKQRLQAFADDVQKTKTEWHNTGMAFQAGTTLDAGNPAQVIQEAERAKGAPLSDAKDAQLRSLAGQVKDLERQIREAQAAPALAAVRRGPSLAKAAILDERAQIHAEIEKILSEASGKVHDVGSAAYDAVRLGSALGKLGINYLREGAVGLDEAVAKVIAHLKGLGHDVSEEQVIDAIAAAGKRETPPTRTELQAKLAEAKAAARRDVELRRQIGELQQGTRSSSPVKRQASTERIAALEKERDTLRRQIARDTTAGRLRGEIADLESGKPPAARKPGAASDPELQQLRTEKGLRERISELERQLRERDYVQPKQRAEGPAKIEDLRARRELLAKEIREKIEAEKPKGLLGRVGDVLRVAQSTSTSIDLSMPGRQGWLLGLANPDKVPTAFAEQLRAMAHPVSAELQIAAIQARPNAQLYKRAGLFLSNGHPEEAYAQGAFPNWKRFNPFAGSERAATAYMDRLRADVFDRMVAPLGEHPDLAAAKAIAHYVNVAGGRGGVDNVKFQNAANALNGILFSPRFVASRFQYALGTPLVGKGGVMPAAARGQIALQYARTLGGLGAFLGLAKLAGADVSTDRNSSDFMKPRWGRFRLDPLAGVQQGIVLASRLLSEKKTAQNGSTIDLSAGRMNRFDVAVRFGRSKLAPIPGAVVNILTRKGPLSPGNVATDFVGRPQSAWDLALNAYAPMTVKEIADGAVKDGWSRDDFLTMLGFLGFGTSTQDPPAAKSGVRNPFPKAAGPRPPRFR